MYGFTRRNMTAGAFCAVLAAIPVSVGCSANKLAANGDVGKTSLVEIEDTTPEITPRQRESQYKQCHEDGLRFAREGRYAMALSAFEQALKLKPESVSAMFNLGACYEATGDPLRAINVYRRVLEIQPNDPDCYANLGTSFIKMYYRDRSPIWRKMARDAWKESLRIKPGQPGVREFLAMTEAAD